MIWVLYAAILKLLEGKQPLIPDLPQIRQGAALGLTSIQPNTNVSVLYNDAGYLTLATLPRWDGSYQEVN